jgi:hypothetical protein
MALAGIQCPGFDQKTLDACRRRHDAHYSVPFSMLSGAFIFLRTFKSVRNQAAEQRGIQRTSDAK